jgi:hypothetical protein
VTNRVLRGLEASLEVDAVRRPKRDCLESRCKIERVLMQHFLGHWSLAKGDDAVADSIARIVGRDSSVLKLVCNQ